MIDDEARARLIRRFGDTVTGWIDELPGLVDTLALRWGLTVGTLMPGGTGATFHCTTAVLKVTPDLDIAAHEATALTAWARHARDGRPARHRPGPRRRACSPPSTPARPPPTPPQVVPHLHAAGPTGFPPLLARVDFLFETVLTRRTGTYYATEHHSARKLAEDDVPPVLLHGDMHPGNVLQGPDGPVAIDPRACVGDPAVDWMDFVHDGYDLHGADVDLDRVHEWLTAFKPFYS